MTSKQQQQHRLKRWSPMACLPIPSLTPSGLLEMDIKDGEVELMRRGDMELRSDTSSDPMVPITPLGGVANTAGLSWVDRDDNLKVSLTTHRLVFFQEQSKERNVRFLHLSSVQKVETAGGGSGMIAFSSPKISFQSYLGDLTLKFSGSNAPKDRDDLLKFLQRALDRKAWEIQARMEQKKKSAEAMTKRKVGVDAIIAKSTLRHKEAARITDEAFQGDAETLLQEAAQLVKVIQKYAATLEKEDRSGQEEKDATQLSSMLENMGMTSALSRQNYRGSSKSDKDDYTTTLARQLADFLRPLLKKAGGLMTLTDVYCIYNRARGTNLISPEDLLDAVGCMKELHLGMSERTFPSGVKVVQSGDFNDAVMAVRLKELAEEQLTISPTQGLTAMEASRALQISALLAHEQLLESEKLGCLCRDATVASVQFFPNLFEEYAKANQ